MNNNSNLFLCKATRNTYEHRRSSLLCQVCGDRNARNCFGSVSCAPCKMFFRRNLDFDLVINKCIYDGNCEMHENSRHACRYCRFKKCLTVGMKKELTRPPRLNQKKRIGKQITPPLIRRLDLLNSNRSKLSFDQWSILSNVTHVYDQISPLPKILNSLSQSSFPPKKRLRIDGATLADMLGLIYRSIYSFLERIPDFTMMSIHDRNLLIERNLHNVGSTSGLLILRDGDLYSNYAFCRANLNTYGSDNFEGVSKLLNRLDMDRVAVKLFVVVLAFSTCFDVVRPSNMTNNIQLSKSTNRLHFNTINMFHIQNKYIDMLFIYMVYRYGYIEASLRFAALLFTALQLCVHTMEAANIQEHGDMLDTIIADTTRKLNVEDDPVV
ncbi:unnamed protein product [Rotaria socialis]|uniref:Nuclear receptor domain-containing protein n=1 Tax=Rotaria socialis TaxID=392032 RepID=A0A820MTY8_9BILA|nr:unnamed protein product [Rotaria socialis]CAF3434994.1 unnamed protein product [Rotaria socialis]CAF3520783.1 unnamed protein product [Rotaria socialis]CAF3588084.1 unnamed protein product [Rotaria socialis]CAF4116576.1 unnamed protein product [Rotaria socialis]